MRYEPVGRLLVCGWCCVMSSMAWGEPVQWAENGHWYEYIGGDQTAAEWAAEASLRGAHLVTMTSAKENAFVESVRDAGFATSAFVTGGYQDVDADDYAEPDGGWRWVTGEPWDFTNWGVVEGIEQPDDLPDYGSGAGILGSRWQEDGVWGDFQGTIQWAAIFEWSADCDGDGVIDYGEILDGTHEDSNGDGVPDCCEAGVACHAITVDDDGPADFDTIQAALEFASDGDEVVVMPGMYTGDGGTVINFPGRVVTLRSIEGPESTMIDGEGVRRGISSSFGGTGIVVDGFTVRHCWTGGGGGGLLCGTGVDITFRHMIVEDNHAAADGGGANVGGAGTVIFENCRFRSNSAGAQGGGMQTHDSTVVIQGCRFDANAAAGQGGGIHNGHVAAPQSDLAISDTSFCDNDASAGSDIAGDWTDGEGVLFDDCPCSSDFDGSGTVDINDLLTVVAWWGTAGPMGDANGDGVVDVEDLLTAMDQWGTCDWL